MLEKKQKLRVFICHASGDLLKAQELYRNLRRRGMDPWLDVENLVAGQDWQEEIPKAITSSDAIIICLTQNSLDQEGYIQREIKFSLDKALEMPAGRIFLIPARLEECEVPDSLNRYHWVNLFEEDGYVKLTRALKLRASQLQRADVEVPSQPRSQKTNQESKNLILIGSEVLTQALDLACLAMSDGQYSFRANVFMKCSNNENQICIKYHSTNMIGATDIEIKFDKWQGCAGQSWGYNAPVVADLTLPEVDGGSKWGLTSEQLEMTKDLSAILSLPVRHPESEMPIALLSFDTQEPIANLLKQDHHKNISLQVSAQVGLLLQSFGEIDPL